MERPTLESLFGLPGNRALVTGASSGLGVELAEALLVNNAAAKGGVTLLTRQLAVEWGAQGITVNAIAPGFFPTELNASDFEKPDVRRRIETFTPLGRLGRAGELRAALLFLASPAATYVTGSTVFVDGGYTAW
jgi:gluconate 5-dehydrogenase